MTFTASQWAIDYKKAPQASKIMPLGYCPTDGAEKSRKAGGASRQVTLKQLKEAKAWDIAKGPIKSVPMNLFMMWMAGNTVHIFSLMMVFMLVMNPVKNLGNVSAAFGTLNNDPDVDITFPKLAFIALNVASLALPAYKANSMGLWPSAADFLYGESFDPRLEHAGGGLLL